MYVAVAILKNPLPKLNVVCYRCFIIGVSAWLELTLIGLILVCKVIVDKDKFNY